jgi:cation:H+ antiporter
VELELGKKPKIFDVMKHEMIFGIALFFLIASARLLTSSAVNLADFLGLPYATVGMTIVALGTTLPELAVNVSSMFRRKYSLALGTILGSCVTNLTLVLGLGALISSIAFDYLVIGSSVVFMLIANMLLIFTLLKYNKIPTKMGWVFITVYVVFVLTEIGLLQLA